MIILYRMEVTPWVCLGYNHNTYQLATPHFLLFALPLLSVQILFIEDGSNIGVIAEAKGFRPDDVMHLPKK